MTPDDRKYTKTHEWIQLTGDTATVGITDHAQDALGDITFIELPPIDETYEAGGECAVIESVKAASDIYAPVAGQISDINEELEEAPETVNDDPYGSGWLFKMQGVREGDLSDLLSAAEYEDFIEQ